MAKLLVTTARAGIIAFVTRESILSRPERCVGIGIGTSPAPNAYLLARAIRDIVRDLDLVAAVFLPFGEDRKGSGHR